MKTFVKFISENDDEKLKVVDLSKVEKTILTLLRSKGVKVSSVSSRYQPVMGSAELVFEMNKATIEGTKLSNFKIIVQSGGNVVANASGGGRKHLVTLERVGNLKNYDNLYKTTGIFRDIIAFVVGEILDQLGKV